MFGQMDRSWLTLPRDEINSASTEVHVYLWALLDVDVGRVRGPLVQKTILKGEKGEGKREQSERGVRE